MKKTKYERPLACPNQQVLLISKPIGENRMTLQSKFCKRPMKRESSNIPID
jgi:hypothetical protein